MAAAVFVTVTTADDDDDVVANFHEEDDNDTGDVDCIVCAAIACWLFAFFVVFVAAKSLN